MNNEPIVTAQVLAVSYKMGYISHESGVTKAQYHGGGFLNGKRILAGGSGSFVKMEQETEVLLFIRIEDKDYFINVVQILRKFLKGKSLRKELCEKIKLSKPSEVQVIEKVWHGVKSYVLSSDSAAAWVERVKLMKKVKLT